MLNFFNEIYNFLGSNTGSVTIIVVLIAGIWQYCKYQKEWNFKNYHSLIKKLNQSDTPGEAIKLYRQIAIVYELRKYPRYFPVTKRILKGWLGSRSEEHKNLYNEMELTINYIDQCWFKRFFKK